MSPFMQSNGVDEEEEFFSEEDNDDGFNDDMEALRQACTLTGTDFNGTRYDDDDGDDASSTEIENDDEDVDLELFNNIKSRFSVYDNEQPLSLRPLCSLHPDFDDDDDDFDTLRAVQRRFSAYDNNSSSTTSTNADILRRRLENSQRETEGRNACKVFPHSEEADLTTKEIGKQTVDGDLSCLDLKDSSSSPKSAGVFLDAIKKNRSCQKFLRSKLAQIEARIEENRKLKERVKLFRDLQVSCSKATGRALAQGKDPRIQLISARRTSSGKDSKINDNKVSPVQNGPEDNCHVMKYITALGNFPPMLKHKKWTQGEKENLRKGVRQQFQEMVLQISMDQLSGSEGSPPDANNLDVIFSSIRDMEITPERLREFLPKVNWDQLASLYVSGRTGAECEAQWLNSEDPLINHGKWTVDEDKKLLFIVQEKGMMNWFDIAVLLGRNRTPFQCLTRFQRSLNARIIRKEWTDEEDAQLRAAVDTFGENDWQSVASTLEGRTGPQCSNRWKKTLHPNISRVGRWTLEETKRLKVAVMLFGPKNWGKIAQYVPGRTGVKCRERWFNCVDPSLKTNKWTEEEDSRLKAAIEECGYFWSKIAKYLSPRTDSECRRRWKVLFPHEVPLLQAARRTQKVATIGNFVDRESERPALDANDFVPLKMIESVSRPEDADKARKPRRKTRKGMDQKAALGNSSKRRRSKRPKEEPQISSVEDPGTSDGPEVKKIDEVTDGNGSKTRKKKNRFKSHPERNKNIREETDSGQYDVMVDHASLEAGMSNGDGFISGSNAVPRDKRSDIHTEPYKEESCMLSGAIPDILEPCDHLDSSQVAVNNGEHEVGVGQPDASSQVSKLSDECINSMRFFPESSEVRVANIEGAEKSSMVGNSLSKGSKDRNCTSERAMESSAGGQHIASVPHSRTSCKSSKPRNKYCSESILDTNHKDSAVLSSVNASVPCQHDENEGSKFRRKSSRKRGLDSIDDDNVLLSSFISSVCSQYEGHEKSGVRQNSCPEKVSDINDEDNAALSSFIAFRQHRRDKRLEVRSKSCSKRGSDTNDEDSETLASLFKNKSKKRKSNWLSRYEN